MVEGGEVGDGGGGWDVEGGVKKAGGQVGGKAVGQGVGLEFQVVDLAGGVEVVHHYVTELVAEALLPALVAEVAAYIDVKGAVVVGDGDAKDFRGKVQEPYVILGCPHGQSRPSTRRRASMTATARCTSSAVASRAREKSIRHSERLRSMSRYASSSAAVGSPAG